MNRAESYTEVRLFPEEWEDSDDLWLCRIHLCYQANVEVKAEFNHYNANIVRTGLKTEK